MNKQEFKDAVIQLTIGAKIPLGDEWAALQELADEAAERLADAESEDD